MKKILSLILSLCLLLAAVPVIAEEEAAVDYSQYEDALELAVVLGIYSDEQRANPGEKITRDAFAGILANVLNPEVNSQETWFGEMFSEDNNNTVIDLDISKTTVFDDVLENNEYFEDINTVYSYGIMKGVGNNKFNPDGYVTLPQVLTVFMNCLGYSRYLNGEYYVAQVSGADEIGLLEGLDKISYTDPITYAELAACLENLYDAKMCEVEIKGGGEINVIAGEETFLSRFFDIEWERGKLWQTGEISLLKAKGEKAVIGDVSYTIGDKMEYLNEYIGREVKAYYKGEDEERELFYVRLTERDEILTISPDEVEAFENSTLYYYNDSNTKNKKASIEQNADILYNGYLTDIYDADLFDFTKGDITLIKSVGANSYDTVIINDYYDFKVAANNTADEMIYRESDRKAVENEETESINYGNEDLNIIITNADGDYLGVNDIVAGDILSVARNGDVVRVIRSDEKVDSVKVKSIQEDPDEGYTIIKSEDSEYIIASDYDSLFASLKFGNVYTLYIDAFGFVVFVELSESTERNQGMVRSGNTVTDDDGVDTYMLKITGFDANTQKLYTAEKVKITDNSGKQTICSSPSEISAIMDGYTSFITYDLNEKGRIKTIEMARTVQDTTGADVVYDILAVEGITDKSFSVKTYEKFFTGSTSRLYSKDNFTTYLYAPEGIEESKYRSSTVIADVLAGTSYTVRFFGGTVGSCLAEYVVVDKINSSTTSKYYLKDKAYLVTGRETALIDDEIVDKITAIKLNVNGTPEKVDLYSYHNDTKDSQGIDCSFFEACPAFIDGTKLYAVEVGDIIACETSKLSDGVIASAYMIYKSNEKSPEATENSRDGWIVGVDAKYVSGQKYGNPYAIDTSASATAAKISTWATRVLFGYVISYKDGVLKFTTQDLASYGYSGKKDGYVDEYMKLTNDSSMSTYVLDYSQKIPTAKRASATDIKTYENYRSNASQILYYGYNQTNGVVLIINNK